jgi:hypothetical protein
MDVCTVETGLLHKKPCGHASVAKCGNCEQPLCSKHAEPQISAGKKTFLCHECARAWKQSEKTVGTLPSTPAAMVPPAAAKKPAEPAKAPAAAKAPAPKAPPAKAPPPKAAPAEKKTEPALEHSGPLEFTPGAAAPAARPAPPEKKPEPPPEHSGPLEFTPEPKKPEGTS